MAAPWLADELRVGDIVDAGAAVGEAARIMWSKKIGCLPVLDRGTLVGLVTESDLLRHAYGL